MQAWNFHFQNQMETLFIQFTLRNSMITLGLFIALRYVIQENDYFFPSWV